MKKDNGIIEEIFQRRSYRAISSDTIETVVVDRLLEAAALAPSCFNKQPWRFVGVQSEEGLEKIRKGLSEGNRWAAKAPLFFLVCTKADLDCKLEDGRQYADFDTGMSVLSLLVQAQKEGLIGHPIAGYNQVLLKKEFGIPEDIQLLAIVVLGFKGSVDALDERQSVTENGPRIRQPREKWYTKEKWELPGFL